jgi:hypothetical protein
VSDTQTRALRALQRNARASQSPDSGGLRITIEGGGKKDLPRGVDVPEHMEHGYEARNAGERAASGDFSQRASTGEAAAVGAVFGDEDEEDEEY